MTRPRGDDAPLQPAGASDHAPTGRRWPRRPVILAVVLLLLGVTAWLVTTQRRPGHPQPPPKLTALMGAITLPPAPAPNFTLTDQHGRRRSLSDFRGQVVVLDFMDPHCTDICPIVSREFLDAGRDLGGDASRVAFLAVNVNRYHESVASVARFTGQHGLAAIPTWHFLTGPTPALERVWHDYGIFVQAPSPTADVVHSTDMYFIDPGGRLRYLASPTVGHASSGVPVLPPGMLAGWGQGIAAYARALLP